MAQTGSAQHWLAGLLTVDPSSNTGPGTSSVTTTNHTFLRVTHCPPTAFRMPKDTEIPLPSRNAAWLYFAA